MNKQSVNRFLAMLLGCVGASAFAEEVPMDEIFFAIEEEEIPAIAENEPVVEDEPAVADEPAPEDEPVAKDEAGAEDDA